MDKSNIIPSGLRTQSGRRLLNTILGALLNKDLNIDVEAKGTIKDSAKDSIKDTTKKDDKSAVIAYNTYINRGRRSAGFRAFILVI